MGLRFSREELAELVKKARDLHMPVAIHTIGDLSLEYVIDALELYPPAEGLRDRIIHCQLAREELIERMKTYKPLLIYNQSLFHRIFHQSLKN